MISCSEFDESVYFLLLLCLIEEKISASKGSETTYTDVRKTTLILVSFYKLFVFLFIRIHAYELGY